jgi:anti-sigma factor RsiW
MSAAKRSHIEELQELLPWYATGALSRQEAKRIEQALSDDSELAHHFGLIGEEMAETIQVNEALGAPSAHAFERLMVSIDSEPRTSRAPSHDPLSRIAEFLSGLSARNLSWAASAAAVILVVQAGVIAELVNSNRGSESTTSVRGVDLSSGSEVQIRFVSSATASEILGFLQANHLTIVLGPSSDATFRVKARQVSKSDLDQLVRTLQQSPVVASVLPAD